MGVLPLSSQMVDADRGRDHLSPAAFAGQSVKTSSGRYGLPWLSSHDRLSYLKPSFIGVRAIAEAVCLNAFPIMGRGTRHPPARPSRHFCGQEKAVTVSAETLGKKSVAWSVTIFTRVGRRSIEAVLCSERLDAHVRNVVPLFQLDFASVAHESRQKWIRCRMAIMVKWLEEIG